MKFDFHPYFNNALTANFIVFYLIAVFTMQFSNGVSTVIYVRSVIPQENINNQQVLTNITFLDYAQTLEERQKDAILRYVEKVEKRNKYLPYYQVVLYYGLLPIINLAYAIYFLRTKHLYTSNLLNNEGDN